MKFLAKLLLLVLLVGGAVAGYFVYSIEKPYGSYFGEGVFVDVPHGASSRSVARLLERNGVIRNAIAFEVYARRHPRRILQAGEYHFDHPVSSKEVFWSLANGNVYERPFIVREGETMFDIARELQDGKFLPADEFLAAARNPEIIHDLAPQAKTLEGFLFPDTYFFKPSATSTQIVDALLDQFELRVGQTLRQAAVDRKTTIYDIVKLGSIVEREARDRKESATIAGVYANRLDIGMKLDADPTVQYALGDWKELSLDDLEVDSPYNTYKVAGLPPTPICNAGAVALEGAAKPAQVPYFYFVAKNDGTGDHAFAKTLEEHEANRVKYGNK